MAFQMLVLLLIAIFLGQKLDEYFQLPEPFFTIGLTLIAMIGYFVKLYLDVVQNKI